jgi:hypothetical protein
VVRGAAKDLAAAGLVGDASSGSGAGGLAAALGERVAALVQCGVSFLVEVRASRRGCTLVPSCV